MQYIVTVKTFSFYNKLFSSIQSIQLGLGLIFSWDYSQMNIFDLKNTSILMDLEDI